MAAAAPAGGEDAMSPYQSLAASSFRAHPCSGSSVAAGGGDWGRPSSFTPKKQYMPSPWASSPQLPQQVRISIQLLTASSLAAPALTHSHARITVNASLAAWTAWRSPSCPAPVPDDVLPLQASIHTLTPYGPGKPLANVSARHRSADVLFGTPAAAAAGARLSPAEQIAAGRSRSPLSYPNGELHAQAPMRRRHLQLGGAFLDDQG